MIKILLTYRKHLLLGILLFISVNSAFAQVDLELNNRASITLPAPGVQSQYCVSASSDLNFQVKNLGPTALSLTASSLVVTLTIGGGNTFLGSGSTVATRVFTTGNTASISPNGGITSFVWSNVLQFTNSGNTTVAVSVAASDVTDAVPGNQSQSFTLNILPNPVRPVLNSSFGLGNIRICEGQAVTFTATSALVDTYEFYRTPTGGAPAELIRARLPSAVMTTNGLNNGDVINVTAYFTNGNCSTSDTAPITVLVNANPSGSISSDKSNNVACYGDIVVFTAQNLGGFATPLFEFYEGSTLVQASSTTSVYTSGPVLVDNFAVSVRIWNSATATLCFDLETRNIRLNSISGLSQISNTATIVCEGVTPPVFNNLQNFTPDRSGEGAILVHQWQSRELGQNFGNISLAATNTFFAPSVLTTTTAFRRLSYAKFLDVQCTTSIASATSNIVTLTYAPSSSPGLIFTNATNQTLCVGDDLVLDGSSSTGALSYQFYKNDIPVPSFSPTSTSTLTLGNASLLDRDKITLRAYVGALGAGCFSDTSLVLRMNSFTGANTIGSSVNDCFGDVPDPFTSIATPTTDRFLDGSGAVPTYQWQTRIGTDPFGDILGPAALNETFTPSAIVTTTRSFRRKIISGYNGRDCNSFSNEITITVDPSPTATLTSTNTACIGDTVLFTASGGVAYEFFRNGISVSAGATTTANTDTFSNLANLETVIVEVTDSAGCKALSNTVTMTMLTVPVASIGLAQDTVCAGVYPTFSAGPVVAGYTYEFLIDNVQRQAPGTSNVFDSNTVSDTLILNTTNIVTVRVYNGPSCSGIASTTLYVNSLTGLNSITGSQTICNGGTPQMLTGLVNPSADSAGATISYQWQNREIGTAFADILNANSINYSPSAISTTTFYRRLVYVNHPNILKCPNSEALATSDTVTVTVDTNAVPSVNFTSGLPSNVLCKGNSVTFDASATTGATSYTFYIQGVPIQGPLTLSTFTPSPFVLSGLNDFDIIKVRAFSSVGTSCYAEQSIVLRINEQSNNNNIATSRPTSCLGNLPALITGSVVTGVSTEVITYQWQSRTSTTSFDDIDFATGKDFQPSALVTTTFFRRNAISTLLAIECIASSSPVTITAVAELVAVLNFQRIGPFGPLPNTICTGDAITLQATSSLAGSTYDFSIQGGGSLAINTSGVFTPTNFAAWTGRAVGVDRIDVLVTSLGGCTVTNTLTFIENRITTTALTTAATTVCSGDIPPALRAPASTSSGTLTYRFERAESPFTAWGQIGAVSTSAVYTPTTGITTTTRYRIVTISDLGGTICEQPSLTQPQITVAVLGVGTLIANAVLTPATIATASSTLTICPGEEVIFTAGGFGGTPSYEFFLNGISVRARGPSAVYTNTALVAGNFVTAAVYTSLTGGCSSTTERIRIQTTTPPVIGFGRVGGGLTVCTTDAITLQATSSLAGSTYDFSIQGGGSLAINNSGVFTPTNFAAWTGRAVGVDRIDVLVTRVGECTRTSSITFIENRITTTALTTAATTVCSGDIPPALRAPASTSSGTLTYRFERAESPFTAWGQIGAVSTSAVYTPTTGITTTTRYRIVTISDLGGTICEQPSLTQPQITVAVLGVGTLIANAVLTPATIATASSTLTICPGEEVIFTAGGFGGTPSYEFFLNGISVRARGPSAVYTNTALVAGNFVTAAVYTSLTGGCSSTTERIRIQTTTPPVIGFGRVGGGLTVCTTDAITLQATSSLAGSTYDFSIQGGGSLAINNSGVFTPTNFAAWTGRAVGVDRIDVLVTRVGECTRTSSITFIENRITTTALTTAATTVCSGDIPPALRAPASTSSGTLTYRFERAESPFTAWGQIGAVSTSAVYTPTTGITTTTRYRIVTISDLGGTICEQPSLTQPQITVAVLGVGTLIANAVLTPATIATASSTLTICPGEEVIFTAGGFGGTPSYEFFLNGISVRARGPSAVYTNTALVAGNFVTAAVYTSLTGGCSSTTERIRIQTTTPPVIGFGRVGGGLTVCTTDAITLQATSSLAGSTYDFSIQGGGSLAINNSGVFTPTNFAAWTGRAVGVDRIDVLVTRVGECTRTSSITFIENRITTTALTTAATTVCSGDIPPALRAPASTSSGTLTYRFERAESPFTAWGQIGAVSTSAVYTPTTGITTTTRYRIVTISDLGGTICEQPSLTQPQITVAVLGVGTLIANAVLTPATIATASSTLTICPGEEVIFTAGGFGGTPSYEFFLNGISVRARGPSAVYTNTALVAGNFVTAAVYTSLTGGCSSTTERIRIQTTTPPVIGFGRVGGGLTVCTTDAITLQATSSLAGSTYDFSIQGGGSLAINNSGVFTPTNFAAWTGRAVGVDRIDVLVTRVGECTRTSSITFIENRITTTALTTAATTVCSGDIPPALRAPASTSSGTLTYRFERAESPFTAWGQIGAVSTSAVYTPTTGITTTTRYRIVTISDLGGTICEQPSLTQPQITVAVLGVGTLIANAVLTPATIATASSTLTICPGEEVIFTAGGFGGTPSYEFFLNGISVRARGPSAVYTNTALVAGNFVTAAVYTSLTGGCSSTTERIRIQTTTPPVIGFGRVGGGLTVCTTDAITLQATSSLAGSTYDFSIQGGGSLAINNSGVFTPTNFAAWTGRAVGVDRIDVLVTRVGECTRTSSITFIENRITTTALTTAATTVCSGDIPPALRAPASTSSGTLTYRFERAESPFTAWGQIGAVSTSAVYTPTTGITTTTRYRIVTISDLGGTICEQPSLTQPQITVAVLGVGTLIANAVLTPATIATASSTLTICPGEEVIFTAGGFGGTPSYEFFLNGISVRARGPSAVYTNTALVAGNFVTAAVYTSLTGGCSSTTERIRIQTTTSPVIGFGKVGGGLTFCTTDAITLQATSSLAGSTYTFRVNGGVVTNTTSGIFTPTNWAAWNARGATGNNIEVIVSIVGGCTVTSSITLIENRITNGTGVIPTTASTTICVGTLTAMISAPASTASGTTPIYTWFESPDNSSDASYVAIGGTNSTSLSPRIINSRTFFKRRSRSTLNFLTCDVFTTPVQINVTNVTAGLRGSADGGTTLVTASGTLTSCEFSPVIFSGTGGQSYSFTVDNIVMQARGPIARNLYSTTGLVNGNRVRVIAYDQLPGITACQSTSDPITMNVINAPVVNLVNESDSDNTICVGDVLVFSANSNLDSAAVSPTYTFFVNATQWQTSTSTIFTPTIFTLLTDGDVVRVTVSSTSTPSCSATDSITIIENTITANGTIGHPSTVICSGAIPDPFTNLIIATAAGTVTYQWESRTIGTIFSPIGTESSTIYTPTTSHTTNTFYRRRIKSELNTTECIAYSNVVSITMAPPIFGGTITPAVREICSGTVPPVISVTGGTLMAPGITFQWQISTDGLIFTDLPTATGLNYSPPVLNAQTWYRRIVERNGGGPPAACEDVSTDIRIDVNLLNSGGLDTSVAQDYCFASMPPRIISSSVGVFVQDASSSTGTITYQWLSATVPGLWTPIFGANQNFYDPPSLIQTTFYTRQAISTTASTVCTSNTNVIRIGILPEINTGTALGDSAVCTILSDADLPGPLALTGAAPITALVSYQWQRSVNESSWEDIPGEIAATLNFSRGTPAWLPVSPRTYYRNAITYIGNPVPAAQEQAKIILTPKIPAVAMAVGAYSISVNGNVNTVTTTIASSTDDLGNGLATKITNTDPHVNASYDPLNNIISIVPLVAGSYNVASASLLTDNCLATILPIGASVDMNIRVMGDDGGGNSSCQAYSNIVTIQVAEQPALNREDGGALFPIEVCRGDPITPITFSFSGPVAEIVIRNLDAGLAPIITGPGTVINPFVVGGLGIAGWYRLTGMTTSTFSIQGNVLNTTNFDIITILVPGSPCTPVNETFTMLVTPPPVTPDFIRMDVNAPGYEVLSSAMSSMASVTAIAPVRWYNNTVCQDRLPDPRTLPTEFFTCYVDNNFNQLFNEFEWDVSPPSAGNMVDNNFREVTLQLQTITAPVVPETYTVTITTATITTAYRTVTTLTTQTTDLIGLDLANKISLSPDYSAIYNGVLDQIVIEARRAAETFTVQASPTGLGSSSQFSNQTFQDITKSGTMNWNWDYSGPTTIRVRAKGCNSRTSSWTSVIVDVVKEKVVPIVVSDLYAPLVLNADTCSGGSTGSVPVCEVDALTLPTQFFTSSINATPSNDYGSLQWDIANISPGGTVTPPGTIDQATGIITWNVGWWGTFDLRVRTESCDGPIVFGNWASTTVSIGPLSGPPTINTTTPLPLCPIPATGFTSTFFSNQDVNWFVNSRVGLATTTTFINTGTLQLTPLANNDLILDFLPGFSGNVIITAEPTSCPGSSVNYVVQIPGLPIIVLTSAPGTDFQRGATSVCVDAAITTITYDISGAADLVGTIGLPTGITSVLDITPQSVNMTLGITASPFTVGQLYTVNIENIIYGYPTVLGDGVNEVGAGLAANINLNTTNFVATYAANVLTIDVSATGKRADAYIIAPSTPVNNSFSIAAPLVTVLQKVLTISGTANTSVAAGSYTYTVTTQAPVAGCAVATATGIIEIDEAATIEFAIGRADNTGLNSVCTGASFPAPLTLATLRFDNATGLLRDPTTPFPAGLSLSMSASGSLDEYDIVGTITEVVLVPTVFSVTINTFGASCSEASIQVDIEVVPNAEIIPVNSATVSQVICSQEPIIPIRFEVFNPAFGIGTTLLSVFPPGVNGNLFQQNQLSEIVVENVGFPAGTTANNTDTFSFNIANIVYTYTVTNSLNPIQLADRLAPWLTTQLPVADFIVIHTALTPTIQIQAVNGGFAFNVVSSGTSLNPTFLTISDTEIIDPPSYYEITGTPSVVLVAPADYVYILTTAGPGCSGSTTMSGTITVQPNTYATYLSGDANPVICDNEVIGDIVYNTIGATLIAVVSPTTPAWVNVAFDSVLRTVTISTPSAPSQNVTVTTVYNYEVNLIGSMFFCTATPSAIRGTITVSPLDQISHVITSGAQNQDICVGGLPAIPFAIDPIEYQLSGGATNATVTGLPPGITANLTASDTIRISGTATAISSDSFTYNYVLVTTPGTCASDTIGGAITVFSKPEFTLVTTTTSANQTGINSVCDTTAIQTIIYEHSSTIPITTQVNFTWVGSNTLNGLGVTAIVSGTNQFVISGNPTTNVTQTTIYNYQIETVGSNCTPEIVFTGSIEINPIDTLSLISTTTSNNQSICIGDQDNPLTAGTDSFVPIVYQLGGGATNATVVGLPLGLNHAITASKTLIISGSVNAAASPTLYNYLITTIGDCTNATVVGSIDVSALPTLTLTSTATSANQTGINFVCDATAIETITYQLGGGATGFEFKWTGTNSNTIATSGISFGPRGLTEYVISNNPTTLVTQTTIFNYQIATMGSNCIPEIVLTGRIQIEPNQTIDLISAAATENQVICVSNQINLLTGVTSVFAPIEYQLGGSSINTTVTGLPPGIGYTKTVSNTILITGTAAASATSIASPTVVYTYEINTIGNCDAATPITGTITVNSLPLLSLVTASTTTNQTGPTGAVCVNRDLIVPIEYQWDGGATGVVFNWTSPKDLDGVTATQIGTSNRFRIFGAPSVAITSTTIFTYEIRTVGSNCVPEILLTGSIEVKAEDKIDLISAPATENQDICLGDLDNPLTAVTNNFVPIIYQLSDGADSATVTGLPPGFGFSINASRTLVIAGTANASSSLSSLTLSNYPYTVTTIGCNPVSETGLIVVHPTPEIGLVGGSANQPPICFDPTGPGITPIQYNYNSIAGGNITVTGLPPGVITRPLVIDAFTSQFIIEGNPTTAVTVTTYYNYVLTYTADCTPDVLKYGSIGVVPQPEFPNTPPAYQTLVTDVTCFDGSDGSIILPAETSPAFNNYISGGTPAQRQIDEILFTGNTTIGDIISITVGGNIYSHTVVAAVYLGLIPEDFNAVSNALVQKINNDISLAVTASRIINGFRIMSDEAGVPSTPSVDLTQTTIASNTISNIQANIPRTYGYSWRGPNGYSNGSLSIDNIVAGDYFLTVNINGCDSPEKMFTVEEPSKVEASYETCGTLAIGLVPQGRINLNISGGAYPGKVPAYRIIVENAAGVQEQDLYLPGSAVGSATTTIDSLIPTRWYTITVTDQASCTSSLWQDTIYVPRQLNYNPAIVTIVDSYCSTATAHNGSIELTTTDGSFQSAFTGGSNQYSYSWATRTNSDTVIGTGPNIYNLPPDDYFVTITDVLLGCSTREMFTVVGYPPLELDGLLVGGLELNTTGIVSSTGVTITISADYVYFLSCNDDNDASFTFNATGGNSNYTITEDIPGLSSIPPPSINNIGGIISISDGVPGFYTFTLDDVGPNGRFCSVIKTVQVINPGPMRMVENTANRNNPVCFGDLGYLEFNILGGSPNQGPYTVSLNGGQLSYTTLNAGDREVVFEDIDTSLISSIGTSVDIVDNFGCVATTQINSITFNQPQELTFETVVTDEDCSTSTPGSVIFSQTGPGNFADPEDVQIRIQTGAFVSPSIDIYPLWGSVQGTSNSIELSNGIYQYEIIDANTLSCPSITGSFTITLAGGLAPLVVLPPDVTQVGCDNSTSIIALNIQNIQPPLNINWFEYKVTTFTSGTGVTAIATSTIDWIPLTSLDQNATVSNLPEGIYRAEISDGRSGNCGGTQTTKNILLQESSIQIVNFRTIENNPALCDNYGTGFTTDVLFSISENLNRNLGSNNFEITLLSKSGTVIPAPAAWDLDSNGILDPKPQGFVYRYPNLQADQYTLNVTESLPATSTLTACSEVFFFDIQDYLPITYIGQTVFQTDICTGLVEEIEALASGGVPFIVNGLPSYQFEWTYTPIDVTKSPSKFFGQTLTNVPAGNYCVKITDKNGCSYDSCDTTAGATPLTIIVDDVVTPFSVTGNLPDPTDSSVQVKSLPPDCSSGGLDGRIGVVLSGGLLPKKINWFVEDPTSLTSILNPGYRALPGSENRTSLDDLLPGNYKMVVTSLNPDAAACSAGGNFINNDYLYYEEIIQVTPNRELYIIDGPFVDADLCSGNYGRLEVEVFDNNNGNLSFYYNGILIPSSDVIRINNYSWSVAIVNAIESADFKIVNEEGCWITTQINRGIGEPNFTYTSPNFAVSSNILAREEVTFTNASTDPYVVSEWIFGDNSSPILVETSTTSITPVRHAYGVSGTYFATLRIYNSIGCSEEISEPIAVGKGYNIMVPNVFTPNNDSVNDNFKPLFSGFSNMTFSVYDYRGNVIYNEFVEEPDITNIKGISIIGWDGSLAPYSPYYIFTASGVLLDEETVVEESGTFIIIN